jgi:alanyl-tRNA synthetase
LKKNRIAFLPAEDQWWGPAGKTGPCGPCTEQFYWKLNNVPAPEKFDPNDKNWVEIGNDVLMAYVRMMKVNLLKPFRRTLISAEE